MCISKFNRDDAGYILCAGYRQLKAAASSKALSFGPCNCITSIADARPILYYIYRLFVFLAIIFLYRGIRD
jgi:hypothetical protein